MSTSVTYPVRMLREHIAGLQAAVTLCLADLGQKPVHKLRTETRRVEALLLLLALVPDLPEHRKQTAVFLRVLAKVRRAAGRVRDLDVQRSMLKELAPEDEPEGRKQATAATAPFGPSLGEAAEALRKRMGNKREGAATALQHLLRRRQAKTARAAEALLKVLEPAQTLTVPASDLLRDAEAVLTRDGFLRKEGLADLRGDDLHTIRKAAKAARYLAESLPGNPAAAAAARRFEALQEAGGQWHDALQLTRAARRHFGKKHELTDFYREDRNGKLEAYRGALLAHVRRPARSVKSVHVARSRKLADAAAA